MGATWRCHTSFARFHRWCIASLSRSRRKAAASAASASRCVRRMSSTAVIRAVTTFESTLSPIFLARPSAIFLRVTPVISYDSLLLVISFSCLTYRGDLGSSSIRRAASKRSLASTTSSSPLFNGGGICSTLHKSHATSGWVCRAYARSRQRRRNSFVRGDCRNMANACVQKRPNCMGSTRSPWSPVRGNAFSCRKADHRRSGCCNVSSHTRRRNDPCLGKQRRQMALVTRQRRTKHAIPMSIAISIHGIVPGPTHTALSALMPVCVNSQLCIHSAEPYKFASMLVCPLLALETILSSALMRIRCPLDISSSR
eukprot:m.224157 g.224157  ORF g.224157 m.224157 type:complete len:313 (+) comp34070_c0_seq1:660-1598(+)